MRIAIIGREDIIIGLKLFGIDIFPAEIPEKAKSVLEELVNKEYNLIFITEDIAGPLAERIKEILEETNISVLIMPAPGVKTEIVSNMIRSSIRKALGAELEV